MGGSEMCVTYFRGGPGMCDRGEGGVKIGQK